MTVDFFDRLALHAEAVGIEYAGLAWDLANTPMSDDEHLGLASLLGGWGDQ